MSTYRVKTLKAIPYICGAGEYLVLDDHGEETFHPSPSAATVFNLLGEAETWAEDIGGEVETFEEKVEAAEDPNARGCQGCSVCTCQDGYDEPDYFDDFTDVKYGDFE